jgi:SAM-dependent methyltransferase
MEIGSIYPNSSGFYDLDYYADLTKVDVPFFLGYAARAKGEILDVGCGTGRVLIPLASSGYRVCGLDLSEQMLKELRVKLEALAPDVRARISLHRGSMASFDLERKFSLVLIPTRSFQALTAADDQRNCLRCVFRHLEDDGGLILDLVEPSKLVDLKTFYLERRNWEKLDSRTGCTVAKYTKGLSVDKRSQIVRLERVFRIQTTTGSAEQVRENVELKYLKRQQIRALLHSEGFCIQNAFGDYDRRRIGKGHEMIFVCRKEPAQRRRKLFSALFAKS